MTEHQTPYSHGPGTAAPLENVIDDRHPDGAVVVQFDDLPEVCAAARAPHVHAHDGDGEALVAAIPGDTARALANMGLIYIALALSLKDDLDLGWDGVYGPERRPES